MTYHETKFLQNKCIFPRFAQIQKIINCSFSTQCDMILCFNAHKGSWPVLQPNTSKHDLVVGPLFLSTLYPCICCFLLKAVSGQQVLITMAEPMHKKCAFAAWGPYTQNHQSSHYGPPHPNNKGVIDKFCSIGMERDPYVTMWQMIM